MDFRLSLLLLLVSAPARADLAEVSDLDPASTFERQGNKMILHSPGRADVVLELESVKPTQNLFHWGKSSSVDGWVSQQGFTPQDLSIFQSVAKNGDAQEYGPGFYVTSNPGDAIDFGAKAVKVNSSKDYLVTNNVVFTFSSSDKAHAGYSLLEKNGISGSKVNSTWYTLYSKDALGHASAFDLRSNLGDLLLSDDLERHPIFADVMNELKGSMDKPLSLKDIRGLNALFFRNGMGRTPAADPKLLQELMDRQLEMALKGPAETRAELYSFKLLADSRAGRDLSATELSFFSAVPDASPETLKRILAASYYPVNDLAVSPAAAVAFISAASPENMVEFSHALLFAGQVKDPSVELVRALGHLTRLEDQAKSLSALQTLARLNLSKPELQQEVLPILADLRERFGEKIYDDTRILFRNSQLTREDVEKYRAQASKGTISSGCSQAFSGIR